MTYRRGITEGVIIGASLALLTLLPLVAAYTGYTVERESAEIRAATEAIQRAAHFAMEPQHTAAMEDACARWELATYLTLHPAYLPTLGGQ